MIPCAELLDGHAEAIGDGDECVIAAHGIALAGSETAGGGDGDHLECFLLFDFFFSVLVVCERFLGCAEGLREAL